MVERLRRCNPQVVRREFRWWRRQKRNHDFASALGCAMCLSSPFHQVWSGLAEPGYKIAVASGTISPYNEGNGGDL